MNFDLTNEQEMMRDSFARFIDDNCTAARLRAAEKSGFDGETWTGLSKLGAFLLRVPEEKGGLDLGTFDAAVLMEEVGRKLPFGPIAKPLLAARLIAMLGGDAIASLGYSEPGSGSDVFAAQTRAVPDGSEGSNDRNWRIEGTKMFTSGANFADYVLMLTRTNTEVPKHKGLTMFIVPLKAEGVTIQPVYTFQDERTNITFYDDVRVSDSWRLGDVDGGVRTLSLALELEHGGGFNNAMVANLEAAEELCHEIDAPGGGRLIDRPDARSRLAKARIDAAVALLLEHRAIWAGVEKKPNLTYGPMAKMFSSECFMDDARDLLGLTAPLSLTKREGSAQLVNQSYRHAHGTRIYGGTSQVHRSMIAERALGLPRTRA